MDDERLVKQTLKVIYDNSQEGDMLMDVESTESWEQLVETAKDRKSWKKKVVPLKRASQRTTMSIKEHKLQHQRQKTSTETSIFYPSKEQRAKVAEENEDDNFFKQTVRHETIHNREERNSSQHHLQICPTTSKSTPNSPDQEK